MRRAPALAALAACGLMGCGSASPPAPRVVSIDPATMISSGVANVTITVDAVLPFTVDYSSGEVTVIRSLIASVGSVVVGSGRYEADGLLPARVPSKLMPGVYDVTVTLSDLRVGTLERAFTVTPGVWPSSGFSISPIANPQRVGVPFTLTITAQGTGASAFNGTVDYVIAGVSSTPVTTGPFTNGVYQESVSINAATLGQTRITVIDLLGRTAVSNDFTVIP